MRSLLLNGKETTDLVIVVFDNNILMGVKNMLAGFAIFSRRQLSHKAYNNNEIVKRLCLEPKLKIWTFKVNIQNIIPHKGRSSELASTSAIDIVVRKRNKTED